MGGVEFYFRNLLSALAAANYQHEFTIVLNKEAFDVLDLPGHRFEKYLLPEIDSKRLFYYRVKHRSKRLFFKKQWRRLPREEWLHTQIRQLKPDVTHHPFGFMKPIEDVSTETVLTFWDMQHEYFPQFFSEYELNLRQRLYRPSVEAATYIIAPSKYTQQTLIERYQVEPEKVSVVYFGVDPEFPVTVSHQKICQLREKYQLGEKIIFYPAATYPHKNHIRLIKAFVLLARHISDVQLVLTGAAMSNEARVQSAIRSSGVEHRIKHLGFVPRNEIPIFFAAARLLAFPSLFEGYGIPVLEAMHAGCPVVCSNICSLPELVGDAAITFDPTDEKAIAEAMLAVFSDDSLSATLVKKGLAQSEEFSWRVAAQQTLKIYESVHKGTKPAELAQ
jgi:glycosyltransferase involved in cell wall biosynthesis